MGFAEQLPQGEGDQALGTPAVFHAKRRTSPTGSGADGLAGAGAAAAAGAGAAFVGSDSEEEWVAAGSTRSGSFDEAAPPAAAAAAAAGVAAGAAAAGAVNFSSGEEGTALDAILEAAQALPPAAAAAGDADAAGSSVARSAAAAAALPESATGVGRAQGLGQGRQLRRLQVDTDERDNRLRPRYTGVGRGLCLRVRGWGACLPVWVEGWGDGGEPLMGWPGRTHCPS